MHLTLDGESFELTPEAVCARLMGQVPESIREYWADVDGVRRPVKQVISLATGVRIERSHGICRAGYEREHAA